MRGTPLQERKISISTNIARKAISLTQERSEHVPWFEVDEGREEIQAVRGY